MISYRTCISLQYGQLWRTDSDNCSHGNPSNSTPWFVQYPPLKTIFSHLGAAAIMLTGPKLLHNDRNRADSVHIEKSTNPLP